MVQTATATPVTLSSPMVRRIADLDEFKGTWRAVGRLAPDRLIALQHVASIESIGSSTRIEGAQLSDREVATLLGQLDRASFSTRDEQEVAGYAVAMRTVFEHAESIAVTENHVRQLHRDVLQYTSKDERHRGEYKKFPNHVHAFGANGESLGVVFETASPFDTPTLMRELTHWCRTQLADDIEHPLVTIAMFVVMFLAIHPFQDGNGRLSRIVTTLLLLRAGYGYVAYASLESIVEANKEAYYLALRQTQATLGSDRVDWTPWVSFFIDALQRQKTHLATKLEREHVLLGELPALSAQLLELCREHGRLTVADAVTLTGANRSTVRRHLKNLTAARHLALEGAGRGAWYRLG